MGVLETIRLALGSLRANKLRSSLTLVGMVIGVFAVIASVTAVDVIDLYFKQSLRIFGSESFSVERYEIRIGGGDRDVYHPPVTYEQVLRLKRRTEGTLTISAYEDFDWLQKARYATRDTEPNVMLMGTDEAFLSNFGYELAQGRALTMQDVQYARPVALLGAPIAEALFPNETPLGKTVRIGRVRLEVVGVLAEKGRFLGWDPNQRVFAPMTHLLGIYGNNGRNISSVSVRAPSLHQLAAAQEEVISHMRVIRKVRAGEPNTFAIETNDSVRRGFDQFTAGLTVGGAAIGLIALLAAGIGIMNIMLVSVTERTREIGVRKAVGAKRRHILRQFLLEAVVLCQVGGLIGIALGGIGGNLVSLYFGISPSFPWDWAGIAVGGVTVVAVLFGLYPAWKAARLDPIESLRFE